MSVFLSIITCMIFALFLRNSLKFRLNFLYSKCSVTNSTHFLITNFDGKQEIMKRLISDDKLKIQFINRHMKYEYYENDSRKCFYPVYYH